MPPPIDATPARVELGQLRELLGVDRNSAGEVRRAASARALSTAAYSMPLRVQWRRALRRHRRLRVALWSAGLSIAAAGALAALSYWELLPLPGASSAAAALTASDAFEPEQAPSQARQLPLQWEPRAR